MQSTRSPGAPLGHGDLEMWAGVECTLNRVGDTYRSQIEASGHLARPDDVQRIAQLGVRTLRYPVLWEQIAPNGLSRADWSWVEERLGLLRAAGIRPIVGLVHHGSGPAHTSLVDRDFATGLAEFAAEVAARFPWVDAYTPVNEPLTTARFSALYGHWYPHLRSDRAFVEALLNQCKAVALAMAAVRRVNPAAQLIQTEDLGRIDGSPSLAAQVAFENERRWLTWDLLCGHVVPGHRSWAFLTALVPEHSVRWFHEHPCPPDVLGINHYATSDRYLDERVDLFPPALRGGNGRQVYADVEAVRALEPRGAGLRGLLTEAHQRYRLPLAITESHIACTREDQLRWLYEAWTAASAARAAGIDVRAVTAWALFGSFDWDSLVTCAAGHYESAAFDVRGGCPRPTAVATLIADLAARRTPRHADLLATPGWWHRPERLLPPFRVAQPAERRSGAPAEVRAPVAVVSAANAHDWAAGTEDRQHAPQRVAAEAPSSGGLSILGATGTLGAAFGRACATRGLPHRLLRRADVDIADADAVMRHLDAFRPSALINAAGYVAVDAAEGDAERCYRANTTGATNLARACAARAIPLLTFSTDLVFDGSSSSPYVETDGVCALNVYGRSKVAAERGVLEAFPDALVVRTSSFFDPWTPHNFVTATLDALRRGNAVRAIADMSVSPTYVPDLVDVCLDLLLDGATGLWHLTNDGGVTWLQLAQDAARLTGVPTTQLQGVRLQSLALPARRPPYTVMRSERGALLPTLHDALERYVQAVGAATRAC